MFSLAQAIDDAARCSAGGTARTTWCGQLSIATADAVGAQVAAEGLDASRRDASPRRPGAPRASRPTTRNRARSPRAGRVAARAPDRSETRRRRPAPGSRRCCGRARRRDADPAGSRPDTGPTGRSGRHSPPSRSTRAFHRLLAPGRTDARWAATVSPRSRAMRSAVSKRRRTSGKWKQRSASMPGILRALRPGKRKARPPRPRLQERLVPEIDAPAVADRTARGVAQSRQQGGRGARPARRARRPPGPGARRPARARDGC